MKKLIISLLLAALLLTACTPAVTEGEKDPAQSGEEQKPSSEQTEGDTEDPKIYGGIFGKDIIEIAITMDEGELAAMKQNATDELYYPASVTVDGISAPNAGIKTRGNTTWVTEKGSERFSYKLNFGKYGDKDKLEGLDQLCLNNISYDPSYLREYLALEAFAKLGAPAPLATYAKVTLNGEYVGLYLAVEAVDDSFLNRAFGNNDGGLYKAGKDSDLTMSGTGNFELQNGDDEAQEKIYALAEALSSGTGYGDILNVSDALKYLAVCAALCNEDSYIGENAENYYLYDNGGKLSVIPWSLSLSFGTDRDEIKDGYRVNGELISSSVAEPYFGCAAFNRPLCSVLLSDAECYAEYMGYIKTLTDWMASLDLGAYAAAISEEVGKDPSAVYGKDAFEKDVAEGGELYGFITERVNALKAQIEG